MSDPGEEVRARTAVDGRGPADDVRAPAEQREDLPVPVGAGLEAAVDAPSVGCAGLQCRRWRGDAVRVFAIPPGGLLACRPGVRSAGQCVARQVRSMRRDFADIDRPEGAADGREFLRVADFLVSKKLCPGAVRRVAEVVCQLARRVPPAGGLRRILPQKGKAGISVAIGDHVAGDDANARARSRTLRGLSSPGDHLVAECLRGRVAVEPFAGPVEPAPDADVIVCAAKVPDDEGEEVETGGDRVRGGAITGNVAPRTRLGDAEEAGQQLHSQDALQGAPFVRGGRGLVEGLVDLLQERGKRAASEQGIR